MKAYVATLNANRNPARQIETTLRPAGSRSGGGRLTPAGALSLTGREAAHCLGLFKEALTSSEKKGSNATKSKERLSRIVASRDRTPPWVEDNRVKLVTRRLLWYTFLQAHTHGNSLHRDGAVQTTILCTVHGLKAHHSQVIGSSENSPLVFDGVPVAGGDLFEAMVAAKAALVKRGHSDPAPKLVYSVALKDSWAKMDARRAVGACDLGTTTFARNCVDGKIGDVPIPGRSGVAKPAYGKLAQFYEWLQRIYPAFAFSRQTICSTTDVRYVAAMEAANELLAWYIGHNPDNTSRCKRTSAREPVESLTSMMSFSYVRLKSIEALNAERTDGVRFGLKFGRMNSSRIEHEFGGIRMANGHGAMNGASAERLVRRRAAHLAQQAELAAVAADDQVRADLIAIGQ